MSVLQQLFAELGIRIKGVKIPQWLFIDYYHSNLIAESNCIIAYWRLCQCLLRDKNVYVVVNAINTHFKINYWKQWCIMCYRHLPIPTTRTSGYELSCVRIGNCERPLNGQMCYAWVLMCCWLVGPNRLSSLSRWVLWRLYIAFYRALSELLLWLVYVFAGVSSV